jgi:uncharacterized protein YkwD
MQLQLLELTNAARTQAGCAPLHSDPLLQRVANAHAQAMAGAGYFDHIDRAGLGVGERLLAAGYNYRWAGENISAGKDDIAAVFYWWMSSTGHRANIVKAEFSAMGLGHAYVADDRLGFHHYWVQVFAAPLPR